MQKDQQEAARTIVLMGRGEQRFSVSISAGMEKFIGRYPRVEGACPAGEVLKFTPAH
jgi:hypothetical protein